MPKKFGVNTKKEEARAREATKKKQEKEKKEQAAEDDYWKETDTKVLEKINKEKEKERKKEEALRKKQEIKEALEKETNEILTRANKLQPKAPTKREIQEFQEETVQKLIEAKEEKDNPQSEEIVVEKEFVNENFAKLENKTEQGVEIVEATGIDEALDEMAVINYDKHPEKRMRNAWNTFFEKQLPLFKIAYPNLKRSQYVNLIQKEFKTSAENPVYVQQVKKASQK